ncbi:MAG TPA: Na+/H+ antiporter subunit E [Thioalkalivibrio sp.]|mgnify:CR=1 FL=1|nr:Na+/H+ antiporter subunit E [Thioalkalivibrio sp.]
MMRRLLPHPILTLVLAVVWLLLVNEFNAGQVVLGLLLGWAIPLFTLHFWPERVVIRRPFTLLRFIAVVLADIVIANFIVAGRILLGPGHVTPAFVTVPLDLRSELAVSLLANTICLTPGTVSAELSADRRHLLVHALNTTDPEGLVQTIKQRYEAPLKEVFEP